MGWALLCMGKTPFAQKSEADSLQAQRFIGQVLKWHFKPENAIDLVPVRSRMNDTLYSGIDLNVHADLMKKMITSQLFSEHFLDQYDASVKAIEDSLHAQTWTWVVGDIPEFEPDWDTWCSCQDYPDMYWKKIKIISCHKESDRMQIIWCFEGFDPVIYFLVKNTKGKWLLEEIESAHA